MKAGLSGPYVGRFAPSPSGALHMGSLVAAMASHLDARAHQGRWLIRIEDIDTPRTVPGAAEAILRMLAHLGFVHDGPVSWQHSHVAAYRRALDRLIAQDHAFGCACSRTEIARMLAGQGQARAGEIEPVYPGTCRAGLPPGRRARAWRMRVGDARVEWCDRSDRLMRDEVLATRCGDFVLLRADGFWAYQLAVVVDDGAAGVTDVVRGADLIDSTARQILLQQRLGLARPRYLHVPVVLGDDARKLSKSNGARPLEPDRALDELMQAAAHLGLAPIAADSISRFWQRATEQWAQRWAGSGRC